MTRISHYDEKTGDPSFDNVARQANKILTRQMNKLTIRNGNRKTRKRINNAVRRDMAKMFAITAEGYGAQQDEDEVDA